MEAVLALGALALWIYLVVVFIRMGRHLQKIETLQRHMLLVAMKQFEDSNEYLQDLQMAGVIEARDVEPFQRAYFPHQVRKSEEATTAVTAAMD